MHHRLPRSVLRSVVVSVIGIGLVAEAQAAGFMIVEQNVREVGRAVSGASAASDGLGSLYFNAASITRYEGTQGAAALHVILPSAKFSGSTTPEAPLPPVPTSGSGKTDEMGLVPNAYVVADINEKIKFGLGVNAPFGLVTEYDPTWVGRYHAIRSDLKTININPTLGYRVNERLSLGFGVSAMYGDVELTQAVWTPGGDGKAVLTGDDWGFGFNLGMQYDLSDVTTLGFAYRSKVKQELEGTSSLTVPGVPFPIVSFISADLTLPDNASVGMSHKFSSDWTLFADVAWTNWSVFDRLYAVDNSGAPVVDQTSDWGDSWRYSLGIEYSPGSQWTWRAGIAFDETPIPSAERRTPRIPDEDRTWLSFGFSYQASENLSIDFAYAHLFVDDAKINNTTENLPPGVNFNLTGEFDSTTDILSAQLTYRF